MKIKFTKLPTTDGTIKVSLDGGFTFTDYTASDVCESGITLDDNQMFDKIRIKGRANVLSNLEVLKEFKIELSVGEYNYDNSEKRFPDSVKNIGRVLNLVPLQKVLGLLVLMLFIVVRILKV